MSNKLWDPRRLPGRAKLLSFFSPSLYSTTSKDKKDRATWATTSNSATLGTTNTAPVFTGAAFGGPANGYDYVGTGSIDRALPSVLLGSAASVAVVGMVIADDVTSERPFWSICGGSAAQGTFGLYFLSGKLSSTKRGETLSSQILQQTVGTVSTGTVYVVTMLHDGSNTDLWINGTSVIGGPQTQSIGAATISTPTKLMLGHWSRQAVTPDTWFDGRIGAFATFSSLTVNEAVAQTRAAMKRAGL